MKPLKPLIKEDTPKGYLSSIILYYFFLFFVMSIFFGICNIVIVAVANENITKYLNNAMGVILFACYFIIIPLLSKKAAYYRGNLGLSFFNSLAMGINECKIYLTFIPGINIKTSENEENRIEKLQKLENDVRFGQESED